MSKIECITPEQHAGMLKFRDECLRHGRSVEPANRPAAEMAFRKMYAAIGKAPPYIWWCGGPVTGSLVRKILRANLVDNLGDNLVDNLVDNLGDNLRANLGDNLRANLVDNLVDNLRANLVANLRANLWDNLRANLVDNLRANLVDNLGDNLRANLRANLVDNLRDNLWDNLRANLGSNIDWFYWGQHEIFWPAHYYWPDMELRPMHAEIDREKLSWWMTLSHSCGWWHPFEGVVFACERPERQAIDNEGRLHHETAPALLCRDGFPLWAWHGVRVPQYVIEQPTDITVDKIHAEKNAEVQRVMIERYGEDRYIVDSGMKPVAKDERYGDIYIKTVEAGRPIAKICVTNRSPEPDGSFRKYWLNINPEHYGGDAGRIPQAAVASTWRTTEGGKELFFKDWRDYSPVLET